MEASESEPMLHVPIRIYQVALIFFRMFRTSCTFPMVTLLASLPFGARITGNIWMS